MVIKKHSLPEAFIERMQLLLGDDYEAFQQALQGDRITSIRHNPQKQPRTFGQASSVPWASQGQYLATRPSFSADPHIFAGAYYVQEASSMFLAHALQSHAPLQEDLKVLDLCAAPGGKSTLINSLITENSLLVSNELVSKRVGPLMENLTRWGNSNAVITSNRSDGFSHLKNYFDVIVIDAPCSGEGMFRKDPKAVEQWSEGLVASCASTQRDILEDMLPCLKPGGLIVYSTCTYAPAENEETIAWLMQEHEMDSLPLVLSEDWGVTETGVGAADKKGYGYRFYPHKTKGEGFFLSVLRKKGELSTGKQMKMGKKMRFRLDSLPKKMLSVVEPWVKNHTNYSFLLFQDHVYVVPKTIEKDVKGLAASMNVCQFGVNLGRISGKKLIPHHHLAVSNVLNKEAAQQLVLNWEQAITFLQKKELKLDTGEINGRALAVYEGNALGWLKVLSNRINNFYPAELRLKKEFDTEEGVG